MLALRGGGGGGEQEEAGRWGGRERGGGRQNLPIVLLCWLPRTPSYHNCFRGRRGQGSSCKTFCRLEQGPGLLTYRLLTPGEPA